MCSGGHYGLCPRCNHLRDLTKHHLYPVRFFGRSPNSPILFLCRSCHDGIERLIPEHEQLNKEDYLQIAREFLTPEPMFI